MLIKKINSFEIILHETYDEAERIDFMPITFPIYHIFPPHVHHKTSFDQTHKSKDKQVFRIRRVNVTSVYPEGK